MHAFIIRPFGTKKGVDFEKVHNELIVPALKKAGVNGYTTAAIIEAGNIRQDMFQLLLTSDIVVADVSIHNANAFYELGIRHALRDKRTFLIRCSIDEVPFDLKTDRYLGYSEKDPQSSVRDLQMSIMDTINSNRVDSPVFLMLPKLVSQNPEEFLAIPADFSKEVEIAKKTRQVGKLALLASEATGYFWEIPALRMIGEMQYQLAIFEDAKETWEKINSRCRNDIEAHDRLATIYQRLGEKEIIDNPSIGEELFAKSKLTIEFLMDSISEFPREKRAEIYSLKARNNKSSWLNTWMGSDDDNKLIDALNSSFLINAYYDYYNGFNEDLNHFYSGINALGLLKIIISLAEGNHEHWKSLYDTDEKAELELKQFKDQFKHLPIIIQASLNAYKTVLKRDNRTDAWVNITEADLNLIVNNNSKRVENMYRLALQPIQNLNVNAAHRQLLIYKNLDILKENVDAALGIFNNIVIEDEKDTTYTILFSGHMIDKPDRKDPRFPPEKEDEVRNRIKEHIVAIQKTQPKKIKGIAGGACGGDILFHEICAELGIESDLYLALPREQFVVASVQFAGPEWVERFNTIYKKGTTHVLAETKTLPTWLQKKENYSIWERNNLWILYTALSQGRFNLTFLALWNGKQGDGPGGTEDMIAQVKKRGAKSVIIDI